MDIVTINTLRNKVAELTRKIQKEQIATTPDLPRLRTMEAHRDRLITDLNKML